MRDYSQHGEQKIILDKIKPLSGVRYVLDIGAWDGLTYSNTRALIEGGWRGVLVEPNPFAFRRLLKLYGESRDIRLVNAAIGLEPGLMKFYEGGVYTTSDAENKRRFERERRWREYYVSMVTIDQLMRTCILGADVISIDIEGPSFDLLRSMPIDQWCPHVIIVEHDNRCVEIAKWGQGRGYSSLQLTDSNVVLLRDGV